jgi:hypothetical protein
MRRSLLIFTLAFAAASALHLLFIDLVFGQASAAHAGPLPLASEQDPPRIIDETELRFILLNRPPEGYVFVLRTYVYGPVSKSDAVRVEVRHKGKVIANQRCELGGSGESAHVDCKFEGKPLKAVGPLTANLIYIDDQEEKEFLLRQLNMTVALFPWMKEKHYQVLHDDMLGVAYAWHQVAESHNQGDHHMVFYFWTAGSKSGEYQLRCTVDGKKVPDFEVYFGSEGSVEADYLVGNQERRYRWTPREMTVSRLMWGTHEQLAKKDLVGKGAPDSRLLHEMAGDWACNLRYEGQVVRQLSFTVNKKGLVQPSEAQTAPGFPKLQPGVVHIDMRLPAKNAFDQRIDPQAIKKSMPYGMPWPKHPQLDEFRGSLPKASGLPDPGKKK